MKAILTAWKKEPLLVKVLTVIIALFVIFAIFIGIGEAFEGRAYNRQQRAQEVGANYIGNYTLTSINPHRVVCAMWQPQGSGCEAHAMPSDLHIIGDIRRLCAFAPLR